MEQNKMIEIMIIAIIAIFVLPIVRAEILRIYPSDDAFVRNGNSANTNFNDVNWGGNLRVGHESSFGTDRSFLKFDLSSLGEETISSAKFSAFALSGHDAPVINLNYVPSDNWNENTITWNSQPQTGILIASTSVSTTPRRIEFNILQVVNESVLSFRMSEQGENGFVNFYSKDLVTGNEGDEELWPYIEVEFGEICIGGDLNCNGCISQSEITTYAFNWLNGDTGITQSQVTLAAFNWLNGVNSC